MNERLGPWGMIPALALLATAPISAASPFSGQPAPESSPELAQAFATRLSSVEQNLPAGTVYRVGTACEYATIQAAVDAIPAGGSGVIRIRTGGYDENLLIGNKSAELIGGHTDCVTTAPSGVSTIQGNGASLPAVRFSMTTGTPGTTRSLYLTNLDMTGGTGTSDAFPGGGLSVTLSQPGVSAEVGLNNAWVYGNSSERHGGGVALPGGSGITMSLSNNSRIFNNQVVAGASPRGGGLSCHGGHHILILGGAIHSNTAGNIGESNNLGGGVYLEGCSLVWFAGQSAGGDDAALRDNVVYGDGGGLYARGAAQVSLFGAHFPVPFPPQSSRPLRIHGNHAIGTSPGGGSGGGIYATGAGTLVVVDSAWIYNNHAQYGGGGVNVLAGAVVNVERSSEICHNPRACSRVFENTAGFIGGAGSVAQPDSELTFMRTILENNSTGHNVSSILRSGSEAMLRIEDSLIYGASGSDYAIMLIGGSAEIRRSTIADTDPDVAVLRLTGSNINLLLRDSIVHERDGNDIVFVSESTSAVVESGCVIWHDDGLAGLGLAAQTMIADPRFADRDNGLYYLLPDSPAINYCFNTGQPPDLEWSPRGIVHSDRPPLHGPVDLGAYEFPLGIFSDRFEE